MKVLVACEGSQTVCKAFVTRDRVTHRIDKWVLIIVHPPLYSFVFFGAKVVVLRFGEI